MFLNGFSIGNVWGIFEVAYLLAGGSYQSAFCCITSGIWWASRWYKIFCCETILLEVIKEKVTANSMCPYYSYAQIVKAQNCKYFTKYGSLNIYC